MILTLQKSQIAGYKLEYVARKTHGEASIVEIELDDISCEIEYWEKVMVCYFLSTHSLFVVIRGHVKRLWGEIWN